MIKEERIKQLMKITHCIQCKKKFKFNQNKQVLWCSMECKKEFILSRYNEHDVIRWFHKKSKQFKKNQIKFDKMVKESGLSYLDYIHLLQEEKE